MTKKLNAGRFLRLIPRTGRYQANFILLFNVVPVAQYFTGACGQWPPLSLGPEHNS